MKLDGPICLKNVRGNLTFSVDLVTYLRKFCLLSYSVFISSVHFIPV